MEKKSLYYSFDNVISRNALITMIYGERGVGKTYGATKAVIDDYLKHGNQFMYVRRYGSELETSVPKFFDAFLANDEYPDHILRVKSSKKLSHFMIDGEVAGYAVALSTSAILKSTSFPEVRTIIFDEFCITRGSHHYLPNEVQNLLDLIETVGRLRENLRVWMLGNSTSITNPYMSYWNLDMPYNTEFKAFKDGLILINCVKNEDYRAKKRETRFGKLIDGTKYGDYAIDNAWLQDDKTFVSKRDPNCIHYFNLQMEGNTYGVWLSKDAIMFISNDYDPNCKLCVAFNREDHTETTILSSRTDPFVKNIINHYKDARLAFETQQIKNVFMDCLLKFVY